MTTHPQTESFSPGLSHDEGSSSRWDLPSSRPPASLRDVLAVLGRSWTMVVATLVLALAAGWSVSALAPKTYEATSKVMVVPVVSDGLPVAEGATLVRSQIGTFAALASTQVVLEPAAATAGVPGLLADDVQASALPDTSIVEITVTSGTADGAAAAADAVAGALIAQIQTGASGGGAALLSGSIVEHPLVPSSPSSPKLALNLAVAFAVGCVVALAVVLLRQALAAPRRLV